jgi:hypothetical protein
MGLLFDEFTRYFHNPDNNLVIRKPTTVAQLLVKIRSEFDHDGTNVVPAQATNPRKGHNPILNLFNATFENHNNLAIAFPV